ncbi:IniB N-terminal domain-containing protein [Phytohabitans rumicis]|uniref:Uncharacterized protein n=1 Tax=Phytohabitans rumicis TaxID=1076125 RepID=A0A6V8L5J0_9ACTN|nr:IniB N-terminal domain-containing protein [Phytohabitans rumicis]GFJ91484.1 hypothetical protein Prum_051260 [Phytohabitans rumicis]
MESNQTLHDFVLNLLTNSEARSAFELDPEGTLNAAGLGDITAADVQDVVPLVVDYAPVQGIANLAPVGDLGLGGLGSLDTATSAIGQLQTVTNQLALGAQSTTADVNFAGAAAITVDAGGFAVGTTSILPGISVAGGPSGVAADLSGVHDVANTLDSDVVGQVGTDAAGAVDTTLGTAHGLIGGGTPLDDDVLGGVTGQVGGASDLVGSVTSGLGVDLPDVDGTLHGTLDGSGSLTGGVTSTVDSTLDGVGVSGLLSGDADASLHGSASAAGLHGTADAGADGGLLGVTDILF